MQVTRQAILRNTRSYKCLDTKSHWKWRRGLAMYCISSHGLINHRTKNIHDQNVLRIRKLAVEMCRFCGACTLLVTNVYISIL